MGRHAALDGAGVHPIVAAALQQRPAPQEPGAARHGDRIEPEGAQLSGPEEGELGWPGEPRDGRGLGWPAEPQGTAALPAPRRGWRRLFSRAA